MNDETRVVLLKPGDVLLVGNVPHIDSAENAAEALARLREVLGVKVAVFADDIRIDKLTVDGIVLVEELSEAAHEAWMETKATQGVTTRRSEWDEDLMMPYAELSERAKDLDRGTVRGVLAAIERAGYVVAAAGGSESNEGDRP